MGKKNTKKILLVGGGTGGHIVPILNIYKRLIAKQSLAVFVVGGNTSIDKKLYFGVKNFTSLATGKFHRRISFNNLLQVLLLIYGLLSGFFLLNKIKPDLIFSKAGYVSFPIIFWAKIFKIPFMIHESDIIMGASNNLVASSADKIFVGFPVDNYSKTLSSKIIYTGQILRSEIFEGKFGDFNFGFSDNKPVIFITGGSQGSRNINNAVFCTLSVLLSKYNLIHHVGESDYSKAIDIRAKLSEPQKQSYFISPLLASNLEGVDLFLNAASTADLIIARASATSYAEFAAMKKAVVTVPYKYAAADHQSQNALFYKESNAAIVISDDDLNGSSLSEKIDYLFKHREKMVEISENAYNLFPRNGLDKVVEEMLTFLKLKEK